MGSPCWQPGWSADIATFARKWNEVDYLKGYRGSLFAIPPQTGATAGA
ncbi:hypothetical protein BIWAKO_02442 [Bosea sp. BIWAKO-01]|nr:hypothetical protein BIWAKO_02442 [Bosea sp. BIWAKO-01]